MKVYTITNEELANYLNVALELTAREMVKDRLVASVDQITDRYLAVVVQKGKVAKMFDHLFNDVDNTNNHAWITVVRIDNTNKIETTK